MKTIRCFSIDDFNRIQIWKQEISNNRKSFLIISFLLYYLMNEQWFYKFVSFVQEINYEKKKEIKFSRISKKRENHHELKSKLLVLHLPTINHNSRVTVVHVSTSEEPLSPSLSPTFIPDRNFPCTYRTAHKSSDLHPRTRTRQPRTTMHTVGLSTNYRRAPAGGSRWILSPSIYARGVRCRFRSCGWNYAKKKKKKKQPRWRRGKSKK